MVALRKKKLNHWYCSYWRNWWYSRRGCCGLYRGWDKAVLSAGEWADGLTNIGVGELLTELPHNVEPDCHTPEPNLASSHLFCLMHLLYGMARKRVMPLHSKRKEFCLKKFRMHSGILLQKPLERLLGQVLLHLTNQMSLVLGNP